MLNRELIEILKANNEQGIFDAFILATQDRELDLVKALQDWLNQVGSKTMGLMTLDALLEDMYILLDALDWVFENPQYKFYFQEAVNRVKRSTLTSLTESNKVYKPSFQLQG